MFLFGLLLPISFIPGITGASIPTQWALLSISLPLLLRRQVLPSPIWLTFIIFAIIGTTWAPEAADTVFGLWLVVLWGLSFQLGCHMSPNHDPEPLFRGLAIGLSCSGPLAVAQYLGYHPIEAFGDNVAGLLYNRTVLGAFSALVILGLIQYRLWYYIPTLLPGFILSGSRGGWLILVSGLLSRIHWTLALVPALAIAPFLGASSSDAERLQIWGITLHGLSFLGYGANAFESVYVFFPDRGPTHLEFVHNDYLQLLFEFGIAALIPFSVLLTALAWRSSALLWACTILATFYFPLYHPLTAFLFCFVLGNALRDFTPSSVLIRLRRPDLLPWPKNEVAISDPTWRTHFPLRSRTTHPES